MQYAITLNNQAMLYQIIGRYDDAVSSLKEAIGIAEKLQSSKSRNHLKFISNLAFLYQHLGKYAEAEALYLGMQNRLNKTSPEYAGLLNNMAMLYRTMGKDEKVEEPLMKALAIYKQNFGEENPAYAKTLSDLGNFYRSKMRYKESEELLLRALVIREKTLGTSHPLFAQSQEDLAIHYWKSADMTKAYSLYKAVMNQSLEFINHYFPPMSESSTLR